jgi:magnesium transporter
VIVDRAIYRDGRRTQAPDSLAEMNSACRDGAGIAWLGLYRPDEEEFAHIAQEFDLHQLAVEDAVKAHQRAKLERYGDTLFLVLRPARYIDETETVEFGEVHIFAGPELLRRGPVAIVHAILDRVVDDYAPVVAGVENDIDEIEDEVFGGKPDVSRRIYELTREVIEFQRATTPLAGILKGLMSGLDAEDEEGLFLRDVLDHALRVQEQADGFRELLQNILSVNLTLETKVMSETSTAQNEELKKISAWAAILFAPTLVGTVYGMNFEHMPELDWEIGYPLALVLMFSTSVGLYLMFKRRGWI